MIKDKKNVKDLTASGGKVCKQGKMTSAHLAFLRHSSSPSFNPPILECKYCKRVNQYYNLCDHRSNLDYRRRGGLRNRRLKPKRCLPEFCPLKNGYTSCNHSVITS